MEKTGSYPPTVEGFVVRFRLSALLLLFVAGPAAWGEALADSPVADFKLDDYRGKLHSLGDAPAHVIFFVGAECPLVTVYSPRMAEIAGRWEPKGVQFLAINPNQQDSLAEIASHAQRVGFPFPVLKDAGNVVADRLGAKRTPEAFVLDRDLRIRYRGRIDDQFGVGYQRPEPTRNDLEEAIQEVLAGKDVSVPVTTPAGCLIGRVKRPDPSGSVTYSNQISRLFQRRCVECHHEGTVAPFSLTSYSEAVGWAEMVQEVINDRRMPPWLADSHHDEFENNPSLSDEERELVNTWLKNGCPEGDPADLPDPIDYAEGWTISEPDQVFYMNEKPSEVPAEGTVRYQYFAVEIGNKEDLWISEAEVKAGNPAIVHHVIVFIEGRGIKFRNPQMAYAPGMPPRRFPPGWAIKLPVGARLIFQVHYTPNGIAQQDRSYVGFKYIDPEKVTHEVVGGACGSVLLAIPPHDPNYKVVSFESFRKDTTIIGMNPHMHVRGKAFKYEITYPDGRKEVLLDVPKYDFNWQLWYNFKEPKLIPKGSEMICTAVFDNSEENLSNPDPTKMVTWGEQTWDEMMFGFYSTIQPVNVDKKSTPVAASQKGN